MFQNLVIVGNLGRDPELRYTPKGTPVANFSMAVNRKWTSADGTLQEEVTWFRVRCWGKLGENVAEYLAKGRQVLVQGTMVPDPQTGGPRIWVGQDGKPHASFEVNAVHVRFLGGGRKAGVEEEEYEEEEETEDEIPF